MCTNDVKAMDKTAGALAWIKAAALNCTIGNCFVFSLPSYSMKKKKAISLQNNFDKANIYIYTLIFY